MLGNLWALASARQKVIWQNDRNFQYLIKYNKNIKTFLKCVGVTVLGSKWTWQKVLSIIFKRLYNI